MMGTIAKLVFLFLISCAAAAQPGAKVETSELESALKWPTYFGIAAGEYETVWARAKAWAENYGNGKFTVLTDSEITTIKFPDEVSGARTLRVTTSETFGGFRISVEIVPHRRDEKDDAARAAHLLAYHLATGRPIPDGLVSSR